MAEDLSLIQLQLWVLIGLFGVFVLTNAYCYFATRRPKRSPDPDFSAMWDRDQLDELLEKSQEYLRDYPNHMSALYFGAKALMARRRYQEAKVNLDRLAKVEPTLRSSYQDLLDECQTHTDS